MGLLDGAVNAASLKSVPPWLAGAHVTVQMAPEVTVEPTANRASYGLSKYVSIN